MKPKLPWFKVYPRDVLLSEHFMLLSPTGFGIAWKLLMLMWVSEDFRLSDDPGVLAAMCGWDAIEFMEHWSMVRRIFDTDEQGRLFYHPFNIQRSEAAKQSEIYTERARTAASVRWGNIEP